MPRSLTFAALGACLFASQAFAQDIRLVSNPAMCDLAPADGIELGLELKTTGFSEIEYVCEFDTPINLDWSVDQTLIRPGYCSEPGLVSPLVFVIELPDYAPGTAFVWQQGNEEPVKFTRCPRG